MREAPAALDSALLQLRATRPTAVNLIWALERARNALDPVALEQRAGKALELAQLMEKEDITVCEAIGEAGADELEKIFNAGKRDCVFNILTHCNAGALATVAWGTALSVVYKLAARGIPLHVWVDETRPRNQGASLTCWELQQHGIAHTLIVDNAGGHLMQKGQVDVCLVGSDRTTSQGDVCNKIGTYLKALAAFDNAIPFYAALPLSTIDFELDDAGNIPIEVRDDEEVTHITGRNERGEVSRVQLAPDNVDVYNIGFDVTPARLVTGIITEKGVVAASPQGIASLLSQSGDL